MRRRVDTLISATSIASVPETPEDLYERARDALRTPPVEEWGVLPPLPENLWRENLASVAKALG